jgi:hypothetical protein
MKISSKTRETCTDALEILMENSEEDVGCILGHNRLGIDHLRKVIDAGEDEDGTIPEDEISDIQKLINRREAFAELKMRPVI